MLRLIVGVRRRPNETWVEYMQRSTWRSEEARCKVQADRLVRSPAKTQRKQQMVQKVKTMQSDRWPARILEWTPWFRTNTTRSEGRPKKRMERFTEFVIFVHLFFKFFSCSLCAGVGMRRFCAEMRMGASCVDVPYEPLSLSSLWLICVTGACVWLFRGTSSTSVLCARNEENPATVTTGRSRGFFPSHPLTLSFSPFHLRVGGARSKVCACSLIISSVSTFLSNVNTVFCKTLFRQSSRR